MGVHQEVYPFNFILPLNLDSRDFQGVVRILTECDVFLRGCLSEQEASVIHSFNVNLLRIPQKYELTTRTFERTNSSLDIIIIMSL